MKTEFDIQLRTIDMYRFNLWHTYTTSSGYVAIFMAIIAFWAAVRRWGEVSLTNSVMCVGLGAVLLLYLPLTLYLKSGQQVQGSAVLKNVLHYTIDDKGVTTSQGDMSSTLLWEQVYRVVATRHNILVCMNPGNAFIIPKGQETQRDDTIRTIAQKHLEKHRFKMK